MYYIVVYYRRIVVTCSGINRLCTELRINRCFLNNRFINKLVQKLKNLSMEINNTFKDSDQCKNGGDFDDFDFVYVCD